MDKRIILLINNKDQEGIRLLIDTYFKELYQFCFGLLNNHQDTEDTLQNVFIDIWQKGFKSSISNLRAYLYQITKYKVYDFWAKQKDLTELTQQYNTLIVDNSSIIEDIICQETYQALLKALDTLPFATRRVFELSKLEHKTLDEIAIELGLSKQTVKNQLSTGLKHLKTVLNIK